MKYISLTDLFLAGLALDITGAVMLAMGLLLSSRVLAGLDSVGGLSTGLNEDRCLNRVNGEFGVGYLSLGFLLQAIGYGLEIGGVPSETGACRLISATAMSAIVAGIAWIGWAALRQRRFRAILAGVQEAKNDAAAETDRLNMPDEDWPR